MSVAATVYSYCIALFVPNMISTDPKVIGKFTVVSEFEYPHCGYAEPIAIHLLLPAPVSLTLKPFLVRAVI